MRILEVGDIPYVSSFLPSHSDYFCTAKWADRGALTLDRVFRLRARLRRGDYSLVIYYSTSKVLAPWHRPVPFWRKAADTVTRSFSRSRRNNWHYLHYFLRDLPVPLVVIDTQDVPRINRTDAEWLDRCTSWFMRELPVNHWSLFLNLDMRSSDLINIQRSPRHRRNLAKIRPFSLGFNGAVPDAAEPVEEKIYDVFYIGTNDTTTVRSSGIAELRALQSEGLRIHLPEKKMSKVEFLRACAQSWLVWSPEGQGWDCHRHYEALRMLSVPLINYPTIHRWQPFIDGRHCLYYAPETGGLGASVREALRDKERLRQIARQGREHIFQHHTYSELARYILDQAGLLAEAEPHWVEPGAQDDLLPALEKSSNLKMAS